MPPLWAEENQPYSIVHRQKGKQGKALYFVKVLVATSQPSKFPLYEVLNTPLMVIIPSPLDDILSDYCCFISHDYKYSNWIDNYYQLL